MILILILMDTPQIPRRGNTRRRGSTRTGRTGELASATVAGRLFHSGMVRNTVLCQRGGALNLACGRRRLSWFSGRRAGLVARTMSISVGDTAT